LSDPVVAQENPFFGASRKDPEFAATSASVVGQKKPAGRALGDLQRRCGGRDQFLAIRQPSFLLQFDQTPFRKVTRNGVGTPMSIDFPGQHQPLSLLQDQSSRPGSWCVDQLQPARRDSVAADFDRCNLRERSQFNLPFVIGRQFDYDGIDQRLALDRHSDGVLGQELSIPPS
jgi:hypothetical protein